MSISELIVLSLLTTVFMTTTAPRIEESLVIDLITTQEMNHRKTTFWGFLEKNLKIREGNGNEES